jgi:5,10-methenyltetrahydromethanopterin hydrogenase
MRNELDPIIDQWYAHLDKGQRFFVIDIDDDENMVEIQHFDGDIEELSLEEWRDLAIEVSEEPENWAGALDIAESDDLGTGVTDTSAGDWSEPGEDYRRPNK